MTWAFSENAKRVRRILYEQFLARGTSAGIGPLLAATGLNPETLNAAIDELQRGVMVMCPPGTYDVAKCPPWSNFPTRHRIEIRGKHVCHAGCALEAMNIGYCYPGEIVAVHSVCPWSGKEIVVRLRGNDVLEVSPQTVVGHVGLDPARWAQNWFHACDNTNFFVSVEAVQAWEAKDPDLRGLLLTMDQLRVLSTYQNRLDYERGADEVAGGLKAFTLFGKLGVPLPSHWE